MKSRFLNEESKWIKCKIISIAKNCATIEVEGLKKEINLSQLRKKDRETFTLDRLNIVKIKNDIYKITAHATKRAIERFNCSTPNAFIIKSLESDLIEEITNSNRVMEFFKYKENCKVICNKSTDLVAILVKDKITTVYRYSTSKFKRN